MKRHKPQYFIVFICLLLALTKPIKPLSAPTLARTNPNYAQGVETKKIIRASNQDFSSLTIPNINITRDGLKYTQTEPFIKKDEQNNIVVAFNDREPISPDGKISGLGLQIIKKDQDPGTKRFLDPRLLNPSFNGALDPGIVLDANNQTWISWLGTGPSQKNILNFPNSGLGLSRISPTGEVLETIIIAKYIDNNTFLDKPTSILNEGKISVLYSEIFFDSKNFSSKLIEAEVGGEKTIKRVINDDPSRVADGLFTVITKNGLAVAWVELPNFINFGNAILKFDQKFNNQWGKDEKIETFKIPPLDSILNGGLRVLPIINLAVHDDEVFLAFAALKDKQLDLRLAKRIDKKWQPSTNLTGINNRGDQFFPWLLWQDGLWGILYITRSGDPNNYLFETAFAFSHDEGNTWEETIISDGSSDPALGGIESGKTKTIGDYVSFLFESGQGGLWVIAAFPGTFDNSIQPPGLDIFTARFFISRQGL